MAKLLMVAAFLVCVSCAFAESTSMMVPATPMATPVQSSLPSSSPQPSSSTANSETSSMPNTSPTLSPPPMMTTPSPMSSPMPSPTPSPSPPPEKSYIYPKNGPVCIHLEARITTSVKYEIANGTNATHSVVNGTVDQTHSMCNGTYAELVLKWDSYNLTFAFSATNTTWAEEGVTFGYKITPESFPNYTGPYSSGVATFGTSFNEGLLTGRNNSENQSFLCNAVQNFTTNDTNTGYTTNATLTVQDLQMQAFHFTNSSTGHFDQAYECPTDEESTNKIVPIVVGAALAGLVIVVLIAYLIGRFRNRKQSSYEALS